MTEPVIIEMYPPEIVQLEFPVKGARGDSFERVLTITSSATPTVNVNQYDLLDITVLAVPITSFVFTGTPYDGQKFKIRIKDDGTPRTIAHGSNVVNSGIASALTTTAANKTHLEGLIYNSTSGKWVCYASDPTGY